MIRIARVSDNIDEIIQFQNKNFLFSVMRRVFSKTWRPKFEPSGHQSFQNNYRVLEPENMLILCFGHGISGSRKNPTEEQT